MGAKKILDAATESDLIVQVARIVTEITGVQLGEKHMTLVQSRMAKRLRDLHLKEPSEYTRYFNANHSVEQNVLTSLLTTHHTFFFREFQHFEFLLKFTLPRIVKSHRAAGKKKIRIWSAACSRGHEVYSLTMFLKHHLPGLDPSMSFEIIGSDICHESIAIAKNGVYTWEELRIVPSIYLQENWQKGSGDIAQYVRAKEHLRQHVKFEISNLREFDEATFGPEKFDIIFCRNVFIYFSHAQISQVCKQFLKVINPEGHLFIGLSESLNGLSLPYDWIGPSVYEPQVGATADPDIRGGVSLKELRASLESEKQNIQDHGMSSTMPMATLAPRQLKVLCIDDSPTVLLLLKRILTKDKGFEVIGTAKDGVEGVEMAEKLRPDIITLDIHMPRMTGVEFLEKHHRDLKIPVVVVSSVPRDDAELAYKCLEFGASDYIEKPSAQNFERVEEELIFKLHAASDEWKRSTQGPTRSRALSLDASLRKPPPVFRPEGKLRLLVSSFSARDVMMVMLKGFQTSFGRPKGTQPGTLVLIEGAGDLFTEWTNRTIAQVSGGLAGSPKSLSDISPGTVYFMEMEKGMALLRQEANEFLTSCNVIAPFTRSMIDSLLKASFDQLIVEDKGPENDRELMTKAHLMVPLTSFIYESDLFLAESEAPAKWKAGRK